MKTSLNKMVRLAVLAALSLVLLLLVRFPIIPSAAFLEYEPADVPVLIGTFMYGPMEGLLITLVVALIQAFSVSAQGGWVGFVMHVIATGTLAVTAGLIYKKVHTFKGAILSLVSGSIAMILVMIPANLFFTVKFYGVPLQAVKAMLPTAILPFNLLKASINSMLVMLCYKPLSRLLRMEQPKSVKES